MTLSPWNVVARAEMTRRLAHGDRYLETRLFLGDGRIMEQVNPGVPDLDDDWREVGRFTDLRSALSDLRRQGWTIGHGAHGSVRARAILLLAAIALLVPLVAYVALTR